MITENQKDLHDLLVCAFRYALGRRTYITSHIADLVKKYGYALPHQVKKQMASDIEHAIEHDLAGDEMDVRVWQELRQWLTVEVSQS